MSRAPALVLTAILLFNVSPASAQESKENSDFKLAVNLFNDGMYDLAVEQLKSFIATYPSSTNSIEARYYLGLTQLNLKQFEDARMTFQNFALAYGDHPKAPDAWMKVAESFLELHNDREAASSYERVKVFHPKSPLAPEALADAASIYLRLGERENARRIFRSIADDYPSSPGAPPARLALAEFKAAEGQPEQAEMDARRVAESNASPETKANALCLIARLKTSASLFDDAESAYRSVVSKYAGTSGARQAVIALAVLGRGGGKIAEAVRSLAAAAATGDNDSLKTEALFELGSSYEMEGVRDSACIAFDRLIASAPASRYYERSLLSAAEAELHQKHYERAQQYLKKLTGLQSSPLGSRALLLESSCYSGLERFEDAAKCLQTYLDSYPGSADAAKAGLSLARIDKDRLANPRKSIEASRWVAERFPRTPFAPAALFNAAECEELSGDFAGAADSYDQLVSLYPSYERTPEASRRSIFLRTHSIVDRDAGMAKLARLVGEILIQKPKANLAFQLGLVYFNDLKDFQSAAQQFTFAIDNGLAERDFVQADFLRARAYELWSEIDSTQRENAVLFYGTYLKQFPNEDSSAQAGYHLYELKARSMSPPDAIAQAKDLLNKKLRPQQRAAILLALGRESFAAGLTADGIRYISQLTDESRSSAEAQTGLASLGDWYASHANPDSALLFWRKGATVDPHGSLTASLLERSASLNARERRYGESILDYTRLMDEFAYTEAAVNARRPFAQVCEAGGQYDRAIGELESILAGSEASAYTDSYPWELIIELAKAYERKGAGQKAAELYGNYLLRNRAERGSGEVFYAMGVLARNQKRTDRASYYFKQAALLGSSSAASEDIANLLYDNGDYAEAVRQYAQLAKSETSAVRRQGFQSKVIVATLRLNQLQEAQNLIADFERTYGGQKDALAEFEYEKAMVAYRKEEYAKASKQFQKVADDYEGSRFEPWADFYCGKILEVSDKTAEATERYNDVLKKFPSSDAAPHVLLSLGNIQYNAEHFEDAIRYYQQILNEPDKADDILPYAMNNLIEAYESTKLYDAALKVTRDFIDRYPYDESIVDKKIKIGTLYTRLGYYDQAVSHFQNILNESGSQLEAELHYDIGEAYYYKGDYQLSILEFLKVPYLSTRQGKVNWTATSFYMAGQAYERMSKFDQAVDMYQQIIDRTGIDATFKAAAKKEIDRVKSIVKRDSK